MGKCAECGAWNSFVEEAAVQGSGAGAKGARAFGGQSGVERPRRLREIDTAHDERITTGIAEFDRVLGGGVTRGSIVLVGGDPGIGKSTLMMQMAQGLLTARTLYVSGEESAKQIRMRAGRLGMLNEDFSVLSETNVEAVLERAREHQPEILIIDSIQTMYRPMIESAPGSVGQVRESTALLMQFAKSSGIPVFVIGHVTKDGSIAGPKVLEHIVDTVLQFEGERTHAYRILRTVKNRYGSTNEIGVFQMTSVGLVEVANPSEIFLSERQDGSSGSVVSAVLEGTRPVLIEVQALVSPSYFNNPQRTVTGYDQRRTSMLLAVIEKRLGIRISASDVFINIAGGLYVDEPAVDLAIAMAVLSSHRDTPAGASTCLIGEIGLGGEVRAVPQPEVRVAEAMKLGFEHIILPKANLKALDRSPKGKKLSGVERISEVVDILF
jgi:DNA repair protein RadA/Sms